METASVNFVAILVAGLAYFFLGAVWYAKPLFGKAWMQGIGKTEEQVKAAFSPLKLVWALFGSLLAAYGIARILSWMSSVSVATGIVVGLLTGICFAFAVMTINDVMESRPKMLTAINVIYHLAGFVVMGLILGAWR